MAKVAFLEWFKQEITYPHSGIKVRTTSKGWEFTTYGNNGFPYGGIMMANERDMMTLKEWGYSFTPPEGWLTFDPPKKESTNPLWGSWQ